MLFEKAAREKTRFYYKGTLSSEDLWDLDVEELDEIFRGLSRQAKEQEGESLLNDDSEPSEALTLQIDILRHIVTTKLAEQKEQEGAMLKAAKKQKLLGALARKQDANLLDMDEDELLKLIDEL